MKSASPARHFALAFAFALILYIIMYNFIEHRRTRNGPWQVDFTATPKSAPTLTINQPRLNLADFRIVFTNETSADTNVVLIFRQPKPIPYPVPFGICLFEDLTFQPGTVVFNLYGHEIQLIPRILTIDTREYPWHSGDTITLTNRGILPWPPTNAPAALGQ
jgi:hypothetical protein